MVNVFKRLLSAVAGSAPAFSGRGAAQEPTPEQMVEDLADLACALSLYISQHTWAQLTTEQKELLADCIDERHRRQDLEDGYEPGSRMAYMPVERWWRA